MGPGDLEKTLAGLPVPEDPRIIAGNHFSDDAAIFKLNSETTIIQTVDFFPPVVDDPYHYGAIAAANSLSDIYAMGGRPVTALNIVGFPPELDLEILREILRGALDKAQEAGVFILGGHSVKDHEIKFGLAVTGILTGESFTPESRARAGDLLVLTKPLGTGIITTGCKKELVDADVCNRAVAVMSELNDVASRLMMKSGARSATDVTGFGLLGHALRMARASGVGMTFDSRQIPLIEGATEALKKGAYPGGSSANRAYVEPHVTWSPEVPENIRKVMADAQTSGGLLISISPSGADDLLKSLASAGHSGAVIVGKVTPPGKTFLMVE